MNRVEVKRLWPQVRAALVLLHAVSMVVLCLPGGYVSDKRRWATPDNQADLAAWASRARKLGVEMTTQQIEDRLFSVATAYANAMRPISWPFRQYAHWTGTQQGWVMFSSPQRHPREIHVDLVDDQGHLTPLYRPRSDSADWRRSQLDNDRFRKLSSRFGKGVAGGAFDDVSRYLARQALADHPEARRARVSLYEYDLLGPDLVRAGRIPVGKYGDVREFGREDLL